MTYLTVPADAERVEPYLIGLLDAKKIEYRRVGKHRSAAVDELSQLTQDRRSGLVQSVALLRAL